MKFNLYSILFLLLFIHGCMNTAGDRVKFPGTPVLPSEEQLAYQEMETVGFIHFTMNTFTGKEWGYGDESPEWFDPESLDAGQWAATAARGGLKELILTAKHHDGFCLWPSAYTEHSVKNSPYKEGRGDIVREFVDACRKHGLKVGIYLSPWDRNHPGYGTEEYITYYRNQLTELLTQYGEINEIWFDGANGGTGFYGGANEDRRVDKETYYGWETSFALAKELQPGIQIFSDAGPDIHWIGNEKGYAGETFWSTISADDLVIGASDQAYLNSGDPEGDRWITGQCDVSIRPGWFYHEDEDSLVKSPGELMDIYYKSVGRNAVLLLNLPPDRRGLIHGTDSSNLAAFHDLVGSTFSTDLARNAKVKSNMSASFNRRHGPSRISDGDPETFWAARENEPAVLHLDLGKDRSFDHVVLQEPVRYGQRISSFGIEAMEEDGSWRRIAGGSTVGYKRILVLDEPVRTGHVRLVIEGALYPPAVSTLSLFQSAN